MTATEKKVGAICARILGLEQVAPGDDLYDLGSDSHQAVLIALEIERSFSVSLPLEILESSARVSTLAAWIDGISAQEDATAAADDDKPLARDA